MSNQTSRSSNYNISSQHQPFFLLFKKYSVVTTVDSYTTDRHKIRKTFHLLVYLLRQLTRRRHNNTVDGIFRVVTFR